MLQIICIESILEVLRNSFNDYFI